MENLIGKIKGGIGRGIAAGLLGLTLGMVVPAMARADSNDNTAQLLNQLDKVQQRIERQNNKEDEAWKASVNANLQGQRDPRYDKAIQREFFAYDSTSKQVQNDIYKPVFNPGEPITLLDYDPTIVPGSTQRVEIYYNPDKEVNLVYEAKRIVPVKGEAWEFSLDNLNKGKPGLYRVLFYLNDDQTPTGKMEGELRVGNIDLYITPQ